MHILYLFFWIDWNSNTIFQRYLCSIVLRSLLQINLAELSSCPDTNHSKPISWSHFWIKSKLVFLPNLQRWLLKSIGMNPDTNAFLPRQVNLDNPCTLLFHWHQLDHQSVHQGCRSPISFSLHVKHRFGDIILVNINPRQIPK